MVKINKRYGGMSDTSAIVYDGQFPYGEGLDLTSLEYITPNPDSTKGASIGTGDWNTILDVSEGTDSGNMFCFGCKGTSVSVKYMDGTTVITETNSATSLNAILYNKRVIWATNPSKQLTLSKIDISDTDEDTAWGGQPSQTSSWKTGNTTDYVTNEIKMLVWNNTLLVGYGRSLYRLNQSDTWEELIDDFNDDVVGLTSANTFVRVYLRNGQVLTYDGASENVDYTTNLQVGRIKDVFGVRGTDYVITNTNQLLVSNGLDYQKLKIDKNYVGIDGTESKFNFDGDISSVGPGSMVEYRGGVYAITGDSISNWGTLENGMPTAFNKDILPTFSSGGIDGTITKILGITKSRDGDTLYFMCKGTWDGNNINYLYSYKKDKSTSAGSLAQVYSPKLLFGRVKRVGFELYVRADVSATDTIAIYYKLDGGSWTLRETLDDDSLKTFILNSSLEFNEIEFGFKMVGSPKIYEYEFNPLPMQREGQT